MIGTSASVLTAELRAGRVGTLETSFLERRPGPVAVALNRSIKRAFDPEGRFRDIMTPPGSRGDKGLYR